MTELTPEENLLRLRSSIDNIDAALIHMLAERFKATQEVGQLKASHRMPPSDPAREARQIGRLRVLAEAANLDPEFAEKWFNFVVAEVIHHHRDIAAGTEPSLAVDTEQPLGADAGHSRDED